MRSTRREGQCRLIEPQIATLRRLRRNLNPLGMPPQPLQIVITSRAVKKNVADQVAIILKNPLPVVIPFQADGEFASLLHLGIDLVANGLILAGVRAGTNQEIISETGNLS